MHEWKTYRVVVDVHLPDDMVVQFRRRVEVKFRQVEVAKNAYFLEGLRCFVCSTISVTESQKSLYKASGLDGGM